jgi:hypothetical protein
MTRMATALDRVVSLIVGVVLVVVGIGALSWHTGLIHGLPQVITAPALVDAVDTPWWRWAVAGAGLVCVAVALRWLVAHRPMSKATPIRLHEAGDVGTITIDPAAVATAAADTLQRHPAVRTVKGKAIADRGTRTIELAVTAAHPDELGAVITAIDDACEHIAHAAGDAPLSVRAILHIKGGRELTRQRLR